MQPFQIITNYTECLTIFKNFHTSLSSATAHFPGIHHHQQAQTFKIKHKTNIKIIKQNPNILKGYVYEVCVPFTFRGSPGQAVPGKAAGEHWAHLFFIRSFGQPQAPFLSLRLRGSAVITASSRRPPASQLEQGILPNGLTIHVKYQS